MIQSPYLLDSNLTPYEADADLLQEISVSADPRVLLPLSSTLEAAVANALVMGQRIAAPAARV